MHIIKPKSINLIILSIAIIWSSCIKKETPTVISNGEASLNSIDFIYDGSIFNTKILGNNIILDRNLPYGAANATIQRFTLGENCTLKLKIGDKINVSNNGTEIII
jgi:hypothetical protein